MVVVVVVGAALVSLVVLSWATTLVERKAAIAIIPINNVTFFMDCSILNLIIGKRSKSFNSTKLQIFPEGG